MWPTVDPHGPIVVPGELQATHRSIGLEYNGTVCTNMGRVFVREAPSLTDPLLLWGRLDFSSVFLRGT